MRLKTVFIRFYKSFNYDYLRKIKTEQVDQKPWEQVNGQFYPYVEVPIEQKITTIVGANESGKSHLLTAIEKGLLGRSDEARGGSDISRKDFCRYSHFFQSTVGGPQLPDFGFEWIDLEDGGEDEERQSSADEVRRLCGLPPDRVFDRIFLFRTEGTNISLYVPKIDGHDFDLFPNVELPEDFLPHVFRIDSDIALPDSVPIDRLIKGRYKASDQWEPSGRRMSFLAADAVPRLREYLSRIESLHKPASPNPACFPLTDDLHQEATELQSLLRNPNGPWREEERRRKALEFNLAYDLILQIAQIDVSDIRLLDNALRDGETGIIRSVVDNVNEALRKRLNFPRVWAQDRNFALRVEATEHELSFIISDRTGRQYSFDERSSGLRHFLSYYIQYLTHTPKGRQEILLMDEPDAFLSGEAQQDLLKVFQMFADPTLGRAAQAVPVQVIYVTHSPFLIDKNHAERVRALEKAEGSKGTRVIGSASQNHYEPLRSAFGSFVGETTFISGCNLMVEGPADQILLAGAASYLRKLEAVPESQLLDLNHITIVPSGGGTNVPYLVFLARGRDAEKPAVIVMLDSDPEGDTAKQDLSKNGPHPRKKQVLDSKFILQLGEIQRGEIKKVMDPRRPSSDKGITSDERPFKVLEDLVPLPLAVRAARKFVVTVYDLSEAELQNLTEDAVCQVKQPGQTPFGATQTLLQRLTAEGEIHMDKVPFARTVVDLLPTLARERQRAAGEIDWEEGERSGLNDFEDNMRALFSRLRKMQMHAEQDIKDKRMRQKVEEKIQTFLNDHAASRTAYRDDAARLLTDIEIDLEGDDAERTFILRTCVRLRATHNLAEDLTDPVRDFDSFTDGLESLRNAQHYAYETLSSAVPSLKTSQLQKDNPARGADSLVPTEEIDQSHLFPSPAPPAKSVAGDTDASPAASDVVTVEALTVPQQNP